ncbi:MAG: hypothetical protein P8X82_18585 [Gemmatimonadales bacterium]
MGETGSESTPQNKRLRGIALGLDIAGVTGGGGMDVAFDSLADAGKTAVLQDTVGARLVAEIEIVPILWFDGSLGHFMPTLEVTTRGPFGAEEEVRTTSVGMTPFLLGFEFRPRNWRNGSILWGVGVHYAWVRYGSLPPEFDAELQSTEHTWGFDARLDVRLGRTPWMLGLEGGLLALAPEITDNSTGIVRSTRSDGFYWAIGVRRVF